MNKKILVVEDSERLRTFIVSNLEKTGYQTYEAVSVRSAFSVLKLTTIDLVLLDLRLEKSDGLEVLKTIRRQNEFLPVIIVSSLTDQIAKITGFNQGCDDYITKPFYVDELLMRVERALKRADLIQENNFPVIESIQSGPFILNIQKASCKKNGNTIVMRKKLFDLMLIFLRNPERVLSVQMLYECAWGSLEKANENSIYVHIRELRNLIEDDPAHPVYIRSIHSVGYRYSAGD